MDSDDIQKKDPIDLETEVGISRRDMIRRGAIVGGALVWAVPAIQSVGMKAASAYGPSPGTCSACYCYTLIPGSRYFERLRSRPTASRNHRGLAQETGRRLRELVQVASRLQPSNGAAKFPGGPPRSIRAVRQTSSIAQEHDSDCSATVGRVRRARRDQFPSATSIARRYRIANKVGIDRKFAHARGPSPGRSALFTKVTRDGRAESRSASRRPTYLTHSDVFSFDFSSYNPTLSESHAAVERLCLRTGASTPEIASVDPTTNSFDRGPRLAPSCGRMDGLLQRATVLGRCSPW